LNVLFVIGSPQTGKEVGVEQFKRDLYAIEQGYLEKLG
jgi:hypothetical protein